MIKEKVCLWMNKIRVKFLKNNIPLLLICQELPAQAENNRIYILYEDGEFCYLLMKCPCGCGADIDLSLIKGLKPRWEIEFHLNGTISISPSVWRKYKCKSHFYYKKGNLIWC